jgi:hypothetical protein
MLKDSEIDKLTEIFYQEAPYDYILSIEIRKNKHYRGACFYQEQICRLFGPDNYIEALFTMLHEIAHARIQHKTHSDMWAKEYVRLLRRYQFPKDEAKRLGILEPNLLAYTQN